MKFLAGLAFFLPVAFAHFTLDAPPTRGFDEDNEPQFCGGFTSVSANRTLVPLASSVVEIDSHHEQAIAAVLISFSENPTQFTDFNTSLLFNYTSLPNGEGVYCLDVTPQSTFPGNIQNGTNATIQVQFDGGDGYLYQCADITFSSTAPALNTSCVAANTLNSSNIGILEASGSGVPTISSVGPAQTSSQAQAAASGPPASSDSIRTHLVSGMAGILSISSVLFACI